MYSMSMYYTIMLPVCNIDLIMYEAVSPPESSHKSWFPHELRMCCHLSRTYISPVEEGYFSLMKDERMRAFITLQHLIPRDSVVVSAATLRNLVFRKVGWPPRLVLTWKIFGRTFQLPKFYWVFLKVYLGIWGTHPTSLLRRHLIKMLLDLFVCSSNWNTIRGIID